MAKYMIIAGGADVDKRSSNPALAPMMLERYMGWLNDIRARGKYVTSNKLHDQTGRRLTVRGGEVIDGPFIESKDAIGGFVIVDAESLDEASELARGCPNLDMQNGYMEVRVIEEVRPAVAR